MVGDSVAAASIPHPYLLLDTGRATCPPADTAALWALIPASCTLLFNLSTLVALCGTQNVSGAGKRGRFMQSYGFQCLWTEFLIESNQNRALKSWEWRGILLTQHNCVLKHSGKESEESRKWKFERYFGRGMKIYLCFFVKLGSTIAKSVFASSVFWGGIFLILRRNFLYMKEDFPNIEEKFSLWTFLLFLIFQMNVSNFPNELS